MKRKGIAKLGEDGMKKQRGHKARKLSQGSALP